jgi:hypothetical protein
MGGRDGSLAPLKAGDQVRVSGLVKAAQHNGKVGKVSSKAAEGEGRVGVVLGGGVVLAVRRENLELVVEPAAHARPASGVDKDKDDTGMGKQRTLERDNSLLIEFHGSPDPNVLVLYHHLRDRAFDCFNAQEYNDQMLRYYANSMSVVTVVPRKLRDTDCFLVCLAHKDPDQNTLCEVAFQAMRQFVGISMLVKQRCFACNRPGAPKCPGCGIACFCPGDCEKDSRESHKKLCKLVKGSAPVVANEEAVQLL